MKGVRILAPLLLLTALALYTAASRAQNALAPAATPTPTLENVSPGVYRLGVVTLDRPARQVRFPAVVNQTEGPVEYLLVGQHGKTHESVLRTDVSPLQVHTAMLLLGVQTLIDKTRPDAPKSRLPPTAIDADYLASTPLPTGAPVTLLVRWSASASDLPTDHAAESLVNNSASRAPMSDGNWLYNGSQIVEDRFQAEVEKSFVAIVTDPDALINNPRSGHQDETIWTAGTARLPKAGTAVEFIIQLPPSPP